MKEDVTHIYVKDDQYGNIEVVEVDFRDNPENPENYIEIELDGGLGWCRLSIDEAKTMARAILKQLRGRN